jgi:hypothetical protein
MQSQENPSNLFYVQQIQQMDSIVYLEGKRSQMSYTVLKENEVRGLILPDFKTYYKITVWYW